MTKIAAFFDFDKTLVRGNAGVRFGFYLLGKAAREARAIRRPALRFLRLAAVYGSTGWAATAGLGLTLGYSVRLVKRSSVVRIAYRAMQGLPAEETNREMAEFFDRVLVPRLNVPVVERARQHRRDGHSVAIVTTALVPLVRPIVKVVGDVDVIGCEMQVEDGRLTGRVSGPLYGQEKLAAVRAYAEARGIDLAASWAYTDHESDRHLLEAVGHPVAVDPSGALRRLAKKRGWEVFEGKSDAAMRR